MSKRERFWGWLTVGALVASLFVVAWSATAADAICIDPPASDQTQWDGRDGTLSYCTSANATTGYEVLFDGMVDPAGSVSVTPPLTEIEFSVSGRTGEAAFVILPLDSTVPEVAGVATFPDPLPAVLLP